MVSATFGFESLLEDYRKVIGFFFLKGGEYFSLPNELIDIYVELPLVYDYIERFENRLNGLSPPPASLHNDVLITLNKLHRALDIFIHVGDLKNFQVMNDLHTSLKEVKKILIPYIDDRKEIQIKLDSIFDEATRAGNRIEDTFKDVILMYDKLKNDIDKTESITNKLKKLEEEHRRLISTFNIESDLYKEKISFIDVAYEKVDNFAKELKLYESEQEALREKITYTATAARDFGEKIDIIDSMLGSKQEQLNVIIKQAEEVLGKSSNAALGQFFKEQYEHSKSMLWLWPLMGFTFLSGAILICVITVFPGIIKSEYLASNGSGLGEVSFIISRLVISPLFLLGAWFCANQYVKRKNIIEDYAYKKVLSLSLLSFKAEIEKTGIQNTTEFIRAVQNELIKSPLDSLDRKHLKRESEFLKAMQHEMMNGMLNNVKTALKPESKNENKQGPV